MSNGSKSVFRTRRVRGALALLYLLVAAAGCVTFTYVSRCIDGCGPYHNRASLADLDSDGDLDVVLSNFRHEFEIFSTD